MGVRLKTIFRSLKYRNYRLFFSGQSISLIGTWMQRIAMPWLVYRIRALSLILMAIIGAGMMLQSAASNTILQTITDDDKRGRVMSFYTMAVMGTAPFGSLLSGAMASAVWNVAYANWI